VASAKLCGAEQRAPPMFGRATITLGIGGFGPHSSYDFCGFWSVAVDNVYKLQFFYIYLYVSDSPLPSSYSCQVIFFYWFAILFIHSSLTLSLPALNLPVSILRTVDSLPVQNWLYGLFTWTVFSLLYWLFSSLRYFSVLPQCGRLSWLSVSFSIRIVSYRASEVRVGWTSTVAT